MKNILLVIIKNQKYKGVWILDIFDPDIAQIFLSAEDDEVDILMKRYNPLWCGSSASIDAEKLSRIIVI